MINWIKNLFCCKPLHDYECFTKEVLYRAMWNPPNREPKTYRHIENWMRCKVCGFEKKFSRTPPQKIDRCTATR